MQRLLVFLIAAAALASAETKPVVVELFTSEGCSSCPPADRLLAQLHHLQPYDGVEVLVLSQHVDYWNRLGWKDPFSDPDRTKRQNWYSTRWPTRVYTPQAVVDVLVERVGSQSKSIEKVIRAAAQEPKAGMSVAVEDGLAHIEIQGLPRRVPAEVLLAVVEDDLSVQVPRGENKGRLLSHVGVVRSLETVGQVKRGEESWEGVAPFAVEESWASHNLRLVAFVQERRSRAIVGAATIALGD